jgi:tRNA pseudouridine55 synthase
MEQMPPPFSAKKIAGKPAYKLAREGKPVELKPAPVRIDAFEIVALEGAEASFHHRDQLRRLRALGGARAGQQSRLRRALEPLAAHAGRGLSRWMTAHTLEELEPLAGNIAALEACACIRGSCCRRCLR